MKSKGEYYDQIMIMMRPLKRHVARATKRPVKIMPKDKAYDLKLQQFVEAYRWLKTIYNFVHTDSSVKRMSVAEYLDDLSPEVCARYEALGNTDLPEYMQAQVYLKQLRKLWQHERPILFKKGEEL